MFSCAGLKGNRRHYWKYFFPGVLTKWKTKLDPRVELWVTKGRTLGGFPFISLQRPDFHPSGWPQSGVAKRFSLFKLLTYPEAAIAFRALKQPGFETSGIQWKGLGLLELGTYKRLSVDGTKVGPKTNGLCCFCKVGGFKGKPRGPPHVILFVRGVH